MRLNSCLTIFHVSILAALLVHLDADSEDCVVIIGVRRNTVYEALVGDDLRINCTIVFCNNSPPTVSWFKRGETDVPVSVSSSSHIKTEWKKFDNSQGISFLVFKKILMSDSGEYQCRSESSFSHNINVSVYGTQENTNITSKNDSARVDDSVDHADEATSEPRQNKYAEPAFFPYAYRVVGIVAFVIVVMIIYVASKSGCKVQCVHCARRSREMPDLSDQSPQHIYENDPC